MAKRDLSNYRGNRRLQFAGPAYNGWIIRSVCAVLRFRVLLPSVSSSAIPCEGCVRRPSCFLQRAYHFPVVFLRKRGASLNFSLAVGRAEVPEDLLSDLCKLLVNKVLRVVLRCGLEIVLPKFG